MRGIVVVVTIALCSCGRLSFDRIGAGELGGDGAAGGDGGVVGVGGDGPVPVACVAPSAEVCNGIDDDCNGIVDDGCPCTAFATTPTQTPSSYTYAMLSTGSLGLVQIQSDAGSVGLWPVDTSGALGTYVPVYSGQVGTVGYAYGGWSGQHVLVAFDHDSTFSVVTYHPGTKVLGSLTSLAVTYPGTGARVAWAGDHFAVAWTSSAGDLIERDVSETGTPMGAERVLATAVGGGLTSLAVGPQYTLACIGETNSNARVIAIDSQLVATTHELGIGTGSFCSLLPIANGYLASFGEAVGTADMAIAFLDGSGAVLGTTTLPSNGYLTLAIERLPTGFWVMAERSPGLYMHAIDEMELDEQGAVSVAPVQRALFSAYLYSSPRLIVSDGRRLSSWATMIMSGTGSYRFDQACK